MEPFEQINPSSIRDFFNRLCIAGSRHEKRHNAIKDLDNQLEKIQKYSKGKLDMADIPRLKSKINEVLESERRILSLKQQGSAKETESARKIKELEHELGQVRTERDRALGENKEKIHELNLALLSIKTRMEKFIEHKREREKRIRELENKINSKVR